MKFRKDNEVLSGWKELKSIKSLDKQHREFTNKELPSRNEVLQPELDDEILITTIKPIDQLATDAIHILNAVKVNAPKPSTTMINLQTTPKQYESLTNIENSTNNPTIISGSHVVHNHNVSDNNNNKTNDESLNKILLNNNGTVASSKTVTQATANTRPYAYWGKWQSWTECSRECGGGIMSQSRSCLSRYVKIICNILF